MIMITLFLFYDAVQCTIDMLYNEQYSCISQWRLQYSTVQCYEDDDGDDDDDTIDNNLIFIFVHT